MKVRNLFVSAVVCLAALPLAAGTVTPGKWKTTVENEMVGIAHKMPATTFEHCITKEDAEKAESLVTGGKEAKGCTVSDVVMKGNTVSWKIACPAQNLTGEGKMTYEPDSSSGATKMKMGEMEMNQKMSGKRLGDCEK